MFEHSPQEGNPDTTTGRCTPAPALVSSLPTCNQLDTFLIWEGYLYYQSADHAKGDFLAKNRSGSTLPFGFQTEKDLFLDNSGHGQRSGSAGSVSVQTVWIITQRV